MMKTKLVAIAAALLLTTWAIPAQAAPAEQPCRIGAVTQFDLVGVYVSQAEAMRLEVYPCGGSLIQWTNAYGEHYAAYGTNKRLVTGGFAATPLDSFSRLDNTPVIGVVPAEPGFVNVMTVTAYGDLIGSYHLRKI
jgi:opacity protein-like surface antigen